MKTIWLSIALGAMVFGGVADAASIPPQLYNKTITTSFTVTVPAKRPDGSALAATRSVGKTIYVSSAGRIFSRSARQAGRASQTTENGPEKTGGTFSFDGSNLVSTLLLGSGASQLVISFDSSFQNCTTRVITGREAGRALVWKGIDGTTYTATGPASASSPSCAIQSGNVFAGQ